MTSDFLSKKGDLVVYNSGVVHDEFFRNEAVSLYCISLSGVQKEKKQSGALISDKSSSVFHTQDLFIPISNIFASCYLILEKQKQDYATIVQKLFETLFESIS